MDIIYSKGNNIRRQACWVATEKPFPFLIGKVLIYLLLGWSPFHERRILFPFLIGKVLTKIPHGGIPVEDSGVFPFLTGKVLTVNDFPIHKIMHEDGSGERFPFLIGKVLTLKQLGIM